MSYTLGSITDLITTGVQTATTLDAQRRAAQIAEANARAAAAQAAAQAEANRATATIASQQSMTTIEKAKQVRNMVVAVAGLGLLALVALRMKRGRR